MAFNNYYFGVYAPASRTVQKLGTLNLTMGKCPFQFQTTDEKTNPAFFGATDGTSHYYGLMGYYRSIPSWRRIGGNYACYQAAIFNVLGTGIYETVMLLDNPFRFAPYALASTDELQNPSIASQAFAVPGFSGIYTSNANNLNTSGANEYFQVIKRSCINNNPINPVTRVLPFNASELATTASPAASQIQANPVRKFLVQDDFLQERLVDINFRTFRDLNNNSLNCETLWGDYQGDGVFPSYNTVYKWGNDRCVDAFAADNPGNPQTVFEVNKVNPVTGNAFSAGRYAPVTGPTINGVFSSNVFASGNQAPGIQDTWFTYSALSLSDSADQALWETGIYHASAFQMPGGGFLCFTTVGADNILNGFILNDACTSYYRLNLSIPSGAPTPSVSGQFGVDLNGNLYMINPMNSSSPVLYWTGGGILKINIALASLPRWGVSCQPFDPCAA